MNERRKSWKRNIGSICGKTVLGAAIGVAGGMALVAGAAAVEGAILSWVIFAKVLGLAGAAGGMSHGVVTSINKKKMMNGRNRDVAERATKDRDLEE